METLAHFMELKLCEKVSTNTKYLTDFLKTYIWMTKAPKNNKNKNTNHIIEL